VEGACAVLADPGVRAQLPPDVRERLLAAVRAITADLKSTSGE
jgi:hypothetical protein